MALVPLRLLWFVANIINHIGSDYIDFVTWLRTPAAMIITILVLVFLFITQR